MELLNRFKLFTKNTPLGVSMIIVAEVLWGINTVYLALALSEFPIALLLGLRGLIAGIVLALVTRKYWQPIQFADIVSLTISSWIGLSFMQFIFSYGISLTNAMVASVILAMQPLVLYFFSVAYLKEKFNSRLLVGSVIALCGVLLIVFDEQAGGSQSVTGGLILIASLFFDCFGVVTKKKLMNKLGALQIVSLNFLLGSIPLLVYSAISGEFVALPEVSINGWFYFSYLLFASGIVAFTLYYYAIKRVSVERSSIYNYLMPVVGVIASILILGTEPDPKFLAGAGIVFLGLAVSQIKLPHKLHLIHRHRH